MSIMLNWSDVCIKKYFLLLLKKKCSYKAKNVVVWFFFSECPLGFFGKKCSNKCNLTCRGCNPVNGVCDRGCIASWKGEYWQESNYSFKVNIFSGIYFQDILLWRICDEGRTMSSQINLNRFFFSWKSLSILQFIS